MSKFKLPSKETTNWLIVPAYMFLLGMLIMFLSFVFFPVDGFFSYWGTQATGEAENFRALPRSTILRDVGGAGLALIGVLLLFWRSWAAHAQTTISNTQADIANNNLDLIEAGHQLDRFHKAIDLLGADNRTKREAGILILRDLAAADHERFYYNGVAVLCAFVRDKSDVARNARGKIEVDHLKKTQKTLDPLRRQPLRQDIIDAVFAISKMLAVEWKTKSRVRYEVFEVNLPTENRWQLSKILLQDFPSNRQKITLTNADCMDANLVRGAFQEANFSYTDFTNTNCSQATFFKGLFKNSILNRTIARRSNFNEADFANANLTNTSFEQSEFIAGNFNSATIQECNFTETLCDLCNFSWASISKTNFKGAILKGADFQNTTLNDTQFDGADVSGCKVEERWAHLFSKDQWDTLFVIDEDGKVIREPINDPDASVST
ncbi:pentapeptide repeat-containing protein [Pseudovibrio denitrificans]|uniref:pentapeptide repeat-containing protein n=1 Tax=Pseudovibrio denitrificans TaxID=258256 RepID=UPI0039BFEA82